MQLLGSSWPLESCALTFSEPQMVVICLYVLHQLNYTTTHKVLIIMSASLCVKILYSGNLQNRLCRHKIRTSCLNRFIAHWLCRSIFETVTNVFVSVFVQACPPGIQCQICHMTFTDQSAISAHYDTVHAQGPSTERRHECEVCGKKFTAKCSLKLHIRTIHGVGDVKTFECDVCSKVFNLKGNLTAHLRRVHKT